VSECTSIQDMEQTTTHCSRCATRVSYFREGETSNGAKIYICKCGREFLPCDIPSAKMRAKAHYVTKESEGANHMSKISYICTHPDSEEISEYGRAFTPEEAGE